MTVAATAAAAEPPSVEAATDTAVGAGIPAIAVDGLWKLFGPSRAVRAAATAIRQGADGARAVADHGVFAAVAGVSLTVRRREILCVMGLSGSGKSTLVRHINGLVAPTLGGVRIDGRAVEGLSADQLRELRTTQVGMVFQSASLFPHRTVLENVTFGLEVRGLPRAVREERARDWLGRLHLRDAEDRFPTELSGGMQQRVGLARTLVTDPDILLLDEPFSALDPIIRRDLQAQFVTLCRELDKTAVFITHDFEEALKVADRIGVMVGGRLVQIGTPHEILMRPATEQVAAFATDGLRRRHARAGDLARPLTTGGEPAARTRLPADAPLPVVLDALCEGEAAVAVVDAAGRVVGHLDRATVLRHLRHAVGDPD
ncbi:ATP-binding cassette domain-containing protein [Azospirillum sp. RWY-5-1]|uniref:ATP-binding cassette domain-containing protein n=1 Tax=Azospirillum oleiclasticum TaxID=2735135 RepID=A0ABX2T9Z7_9PROT|nr:ATP-binding cassette domain-containing protein [Azospirillum oleiclasticum]NYZ17671.1 ATP-binding cassette domain-containing protein [Azospirillum oleiclasticum]NYZ21149.1 ATP-binding cassette domain-containing protein [Azospirillum oleiclasticum]